MTYEEYMSFVQTKIVDVLKKGVNPWQPPWDAAQNGATGRPYNGINALLLSIISELNFEGENRYYTFDQVKKLGSKVKKGEHSTPAFYFSTSYVRNAKDKDGNQLFDEEGNPVREIVNIPPTFRVYSLFNAQQLDPVPERIVERDEKFSQYDKQMADDIVKSSPTEIKYTSGNRAFYSPMQDIIQVPGQERYAHNEQEFYSTLFHEMIHSTGATHRLNRNLEGHHFGSNEYAKEELIAEIASLNLCDKCGMKYTNENSAAYIESWASLVQDKDFNFANLYKEVSEASQYLLQPENRDRLHEIAISRVIKADRVSDAEAVYEPMVRLDGCGFNQTLPLREADIVLKSLNKNQQETSCGIIHELAFQMLYKKNGLDCIYKGSFRAGAETDGLMSHIKEISSKANQRTIDEEIRFKFETFSKEVYPYLENHIKLATIKDLYSTHMDNMKDISAEEKSYIAYVLAKVEEGQKNLNENIKSPLPKIKTKDEFICDMKKDRSNGFEKVKSFFHKR